MDGFRSQASRSAASPAGTLAVELNWGGLLLFFLALHECTHYLSSYNRLDAIPMFADLLVKDHRPVNWREAFHAAYRERFNDEESYEAQLTAINTKEEFASANSQRLSAELACDAVAFALIQIWCEHNSVPLFEGYRAAWCCLMNTRLLQSVRVFVQEMAHSQPLTGVDDSVQLIDVRASKLMNVYVAVASNKLAERERRMIREEVISLSKKYANNIEKPLRETVAPLVDRRRVNLILKKAMSGQVATLRQRVEFCNQVATQMGWRHGSDDVAHAIL